MSLSTAASCLCFQVYPVAHILNNNVQGTPDGVQRTKQSSWGAANKEQMVKACAVVFNFIGTTYHRHFKESAGYDPNGKRVLVSVYVG